MGPNIFRLQSPHGLFPIAPPDRLNLNKCRYSKVRRAAFRVPSAASDQRRSSIRRRPHLEQRTAEDDTEMSV